MFDHTQLASTAKSKRKVFIVTVATVIMFLSGFTMVSAKNQREVSSSETDMTTSLKAKAAHATINEYTGPETCNECHLKQAKQMHGSVHYQQTGLTPNATNIEGTAGKAENAFNTYCGSIRTSPYFTCVGCHVGNGLPPEPDETTEQLNNIDCMMCHQEDYKRIGAPPYEDFEVIGEDGLPTTIQIPVAETFRFIPDEENMTISILEAARTVHPTNRKTCLRCHSGASGSDGGKRGDLSFVTVDPPLSSDIHMSSHGEDLTCSACHSAGDHRIAGRGLDLRPNDYPEQLVCSGCHTEQPHEDYDPTGADSLDRHATRVACQTCHIPTFAKDISTELERDWEDLHYSEFSCSGRGGWVPHEIRESNVIPSYKWYDGTSEVYVLGEIPTEREDSDSDEDVDEDGEKMFGIPNGAVNTENARIYPMKEHRAKIAQHVDTQVMIPHSTFTLFTQASFDLAVLDGMAQEGLEGEYDMVDVHTYQTINHGVEGKKSALKCRDCHAPNARMDLEGQLGYELKDTPEQVCTQCHSVKKLKRLKRLNGFRPMHKKHVTINKIDCSACHNFSREERGLSTDIDDFQDNFGKRIKRRIMKARKKMKSRAIERVRTAMSRIKTEQKE
ncbi:MAG: multiheme c-type cytochrome [Gammaproteobacteria bacterium]|nr:multiheme c-type cytochrome [Gammaproteobacteria bacterium]